MDLIHKRSLSPSSGFGSCLPHLKVVWLEVWVQVDWNRFLDFVCPALNTCYAHRPILVRQKIQGKAKFRFWTGADEQCHDGRIFTKIL